MKIGKYSFKNKKIADLRIKALGVATDEDGNEYATHPHHVVKLGYIQLKPAEYDNKGEETKPPVLSKKYHVDVNWSLEDTHKKDGSVTKAVHPRGWNSSSIDLDNNGVHAFYGIDYLTNKI